MLRQTHMTRSHSPVYDTYDVVPWCAMCVLYVVDLHAPVSESRVWYWNQPVCACLL